jgi:hypothetical protein
MKKFLVFIAAIILPLQLFAHGGGLNSFGCHNQTSNSSYHCHSGQLDGQSFPNQDAAQAALDALNANTAPSVSIIGGSRTVSDTNDLNGETISFLASSTDSDGTVSSNEWLIGGVVVANGTLANLFLSNGTTTVTFQATDNDGATASTTATITVSAPVPNTSPTVSISGGNKTIADTDNSSGEPISFSATATDNDGSIATSEWLVNGSVVANGLSVSISLIDGITEVTFRATDNDGASSSTSVSITVKEASNGFPVYDRDEYLTNWLDRDGDCIDTRDEVLILESAIPVTLSDNGCDVLAGLWNDPYTAISFTSPSDLDIDHLVPLSEAHDSGAAYWTTEEKRAFANDTTTAHALIAVDASANRSKGARDPALWLPTNQTYHCEYVRNWVDIKNKYNLSMDEDEQSVIESVLGKSLSEGSRAEVIGIRNSSGDSTARFALGITKNSECGYSSDATSLDSVKLSLSITPEEAQLGQPFDIFLVVSLNSQLFVISPAGELLPFSGDVSDLVAFMSATTLHESYEFTLFEGFLDAGLSFDMFVAYLSSDGALVFTPTPLSVSIQAP